MSSVNFPLTFSLAPFPTGEALNADEYGQQLVTNLQAFISGNFLTGQIGGTQPTQDIGPWLNGNNWWFWDPALSTYVPQSITSSLPTGSIVAFGGISAPSGYLLCDGASYLIANQLPLFGVIGTSYGNAGGGTFRVPDYRGRVAVGAGTGTGLTPRSIGTALGEETHPLVAFENAAHAHTVPATSHAHGAFGVSNPHFHNVTAFSSTVQGLQTGGATFFVPSVVSTSTQSDSGVAVTVNAATIPAFSSLNSGSGTPHNNIQPSLIASYIIKN